MIYEEIEAGKNLLIFGILRNNRFQILKSFRLLYHAFQDIPLPFGYI